MTKSGKRPMDAGDDVATLLRLAGKRPAVARERAERVRAAAESVWRVEVRRRRGRALRRGAALAVAASAVLALLAWWLVPGARSPAGHEAAFRVELLRGEASFRESAGAGAASARAVSAGAELPIGSLLATAGDGRVALRMGTGHSVRLDRSTSVRLLGATALALDRGAVYVDSGSAGAGPVPLEVHTPLGIVREIGTQFEVRLADDSVRLRMREGAARLLDHEVRAGTELQLDPRGGVTRGTIATHGREWDWIVGVAPMLDLEGRTARAFLDWVARERGLRLAFTDEPTARAAGEIVLGGSAARLTPADALDAVLPACRMAYRIDGDVLRIGALPD